MSRTSSAPSGSWHPGPRVEGRDGTEIATYHLGGSGPPVMLAHATGFHGRCWIPLAPAVADRFTVWAIDQRGHGSSGKSPDGRYDDWGVFSDDLLAVLDVLGPGQEWRGLGHSLGGAVLFMAELARPGTFASLCVYEPIVMPTSEPVRGAGPRANPLSDVARKRRARFPSLEAAYHNYAGKRPFAGFDPAALHAYVTYGFVETPTGVALACDPHDEASVYDGAVRHGTWDRLDGVGASVSVMGGTNDGQLPATLLEPVASRLPLGDVHRFEQLSHFGPFEKPLLVGAAAANVFDSGGRRSTIAVPAPR